MTPLPLAPLECKANCELAEATLIVIATIGQLSQTTFLFGDHYGKWRAGLRIHKVGSVRVEPIHVEIMVIENVKALGTKLHLDLLSDCECLANGQVESPCARAAESIASYHV